jgi:hypothetical protein
MRRLKPLFAASIVFQSVRISPILGGLAKRDWSICSPVFLTLVLFSNTPELLSSWRSLHTASLESRFEAMLSQTFLKSREVTSLLQTPINNIHHLIYIMVMRIGVLLRHYQTNHLLLRIGPIHRAEIATPGK